MSDNQGNEALLLALGEIKGELGGIRAQIVESNAATNRRIDDLTKSVDKQTAALNQRIDDHQQDVDQRFNGVDTRMLEIEKDQKVSKRNTVITSTGVAAVASGMAEVIKAVAN